MSSEVQNMPVLVAWGQLWIVTAAVAVQGIFKSGDPAKRARAIVQAVTHYQGECNSRERGCLCVTSGRSMCFWQVWSCSC